MHILTGLHDPRVTPATVLYDQWKATLEAWYGPLDYNKTSQVLHLGLDSQSGIGVVDNLDNTNNDRHAIAFGYASRHHISPLLTINSDGEFRFNHKLHGWKQRDFLARNTFLKWRHVAREYTWEIGEGEGTYTDPDWRDPTHYVDEKVLGMYSHRYRGSAWLRPQYQNGAWIIGFSRSAAAGATVTFDDFARFDLLRERRYRSWERTYLINTGVIKPNQPRSRLTPEEQRERFDKSAASLTGLMSVTTQPINHRTKKESV